MKDLWAKLDEVYEKFVDEHIISDPRLEGIVHNILVLPLFAAEASQQGMSIPSDPAILRSLFEEQSNKLTLQGQDPLAPAIVVLLTGELPEDVVFPKEIDGIAIYTELPVSGLGNERCENCSNESDGCCKDEGCGNDCGCGPHLTNPT